MPGEPLTLPRYGLVDIDRWQDLHNNQGVHLHVFLDGIDLMDGKRGGVKWANDETGEVFVMKPHPLTRGPYIEEVDGVPQMATELLTGKVELIDLPHGGSCAEFVARQNALN